MRKFTILFTVLLLLLFSTIITAQNISNHLTVHQKEAFTKIIKEQNPKLYDRIFNSDEQIKNNNTRVTKIANADEGGITQTLVEEWISNAWENSILWTYTFEQGSNTSTTLEQAWENDQWVDRYFDTTTMDNQQNPIEDITQEWKNNEWVNFSKMMMQYNENNDMTEMIWQDWNDTTNTWINFMKITYTHDNNYNLIEDLTEFWENDNWEGFQKGTHTYNAKNQIVTSITQWWLDAVWTDWGKITYSYNSKDLLIDELHESLNFVTQTLATSEHWTYEYNDQDQEIVRFIEKFDMFTSARISYTKVSTSYTAENIAEEITQEWGVSDWENEEKETYTYEDNQLTVILYQIWENNDWVNRERWTNTYGGAVDVVTSTQLPSKFELKQNYPNPFNPVTRIGYSVNKSNNVELIIYDILGNYITTLVNELQTPGNYVVNFNAADYSSGTYVYSIKLGNKTISKKCLLIK